jgi:hypothetical protein
LGQSEYFNVNQVVERQFARAFFGIPTSLSIVLQSTVIGTYCVSIRSIDLSLSYVAECVITSANTPQYFQIENVPQAPVGGPGTYGVLDTDGAYIVSVCAGCGVGFQGINRVWTGGNLLGTANQTDLFATLGATLDFTLLQHENAPTCAPFIYTPFDLELTRCQRYYFKSIDYGLYAGSLAPSYTVPSPSTGTTISPLPPLIYTSPLRIAPVFGTGLMIYSGNTGTINKVYDLTAAADITVNSATSTSSSLGTMTLASAPTSSGFVTFYVIADVDF